MSGPSQPAPAPKLPLAIVTGANTGIGLHTAGQLAQSGHHVILACRSEARAREALRRLYQRYGAGISLEVRHLDLAVLESVRSFASEVAGGHASLAVLVCNAGLNSASAPQDPDKQLTADGVDLVYQTNFLAHFLLTLLFLPMLSAARGRVVSITSVFHRGADIAYLDLIKTTREPYVSLYGLSKLAQILMNGELHGRFGVALGVDFHSVNPGGVSSDIWRQYPRWQQWLFAFIMASPETAARTVLKACLCKEGQSTAPKYWNGYYGAGRLSLMEYWSPVPARDSLIPSEPETSTNNPVIARQFWDRNVGALCVAGIDVMSAIDVLGR
mmetsp:Transcript_55580/g.156459  ORF Transcript_55580/g.156459 Transcript_55580/m.156459 type:complete len:328 (-) Transcript_55580:44-1027(-)